jgi:hypothetical protein
MTRKAKKTFGTITGCSLENRPLETALHQKNGWLRMMAAQLREWAQDIIRDDRLTTASLLELKGYKDAAEELRGFTFNTNEDKQAERAA